MIGLYFFILCIVGIAAYGIYELYNYMQRKSAMQELTGPGKDSKFMNDILRLVNDQAAGGKDKVVSKNKVSKVYLMEALNLPPRLLKQYVERLQRKDLVKESGDNVTITPFGVKFFKTFSNDKLNIGK